MMKLLQRFFIFLIFFSPIFHLCLYFSFGVNHLTSLSYLSMGCYILCYFYFYERLFALCSDFTSAQDSSYCDCFPKLPSSSHIASVPLSSFFCSFGSFPLMLSCLSACVWGCVGVVNGGLRCRAIWLENPWISGSVDPLGCSASQEGIPSSSAQETEGGGNLMTPSAFSNASWHPLCQVSPSPEYVQFNMCREYPPVFYRLGEVAIIK